MTRAARHRALNGTIKIERGIPPPERHGPNAKYPWDAMHRGESFFVAAPVSRLSAAANAAARRRGWKLVTRAVEGGARVWRVK